MNEKRSYIWRLACFLQTNGMVISGEELAEHLNRNNFLTTYGAQYQGRRGTYTLIQSIHDWLKVELKMPNEAQHVALAFVKPGGGYAY